MHGMTGDLTDNAQLFTDVHSFADFLYKEIEEAYIAKQNEVQVIDDVDEETVSDEPIISGNKDAESNIVKFDRYDGTFFSGYSVIIQDQHVDDKFVGVKVYIGKSANENEDMSTYDNSDDSLVYVSDKEDVALLFWSDGFYRTQ